MGSHLSLHKAQDVEKLRRVLGVSVSDVLARGGNNGRGDSQTISSDSTVEAALLALERGQGVAVVVDRLGKFVGVIDIHCILDFLVTLYRGAVMERREDVIHTVYDPFFWGYWDEWVEKRRVLVLSPQAPRVVADGAVEFFALSVGELMKTPVWNLHSRVAPVPLRPDTTLHSALPVLSAYHSALVDLGEGAHRLVTQTDVLRFLETDLSGCCAFHDVRARDLDIFKHQHLETCHVGDRALLALQRMNKYGVTALPIVQDDSKRLLSELSIAHLQAVKATNFSILLSTVGHLVEQTDPALAVPAMGDKDTTFGEMLRSMIEMGRTHMWITDGEHRLTGVVSLVDILKHLTAITDRK